MNIDTLPMGEKTHGKARFHHQIADTHQLPWSDKWASNEGLPIAADLAPYESRKAEVFDQDGLLTPGSVSKLVREESNSFDELQDLRN